MEKKQAIRRKERIPIVMRNLDIEKFLKNNLGLLYTPKVIPNIIKDWDKIEEIWKEVYDQRLGQLLINQGYLPDDYRTWNVEEDNYMIETGMIDAADIKFWGINYDKNNNKLPKTKWTLIRDLETSHIEAILDGDYVSDNIKYKNYFENELEKRYDEQINDD